ncbi:hypothetical protein B0I37DRAFT_368797 [Chaetomium sp. MPI-CAGE-AT-0009]|nr:hypothetical protein B0I37DRAFT_368797 [Chaetomium sp. MPI-CAGE-AT-0009]
MLPLEHTVSFSGPEHPSTPPYVAVSILDPLITIERHHGKYHVAARFNMETTILNYYENQQRDGHEYFFQDIRLQYWSPRPNEMLSMKPESDPSAAMTVTRGTEITRSMGAELSLSEAPSANVSLGLDRTRTLTVEYALGTWSLSAHHIIPRTTTTAPKPLSQSKKTQQAAATNEERPVFQWFWTGTHRETETLTPDLKYTVKRHVVAKRIIPIESFPAPKEEEGDEVEEGPPVDSSNLINVQSTAAGADDALPRNEGKQDATPGERAKTTANGDEVARLHTLESLLDFSFRVEQVRVKRRFGRFHRLMILSGNEVKGKLLKPSCEQGFRLRASPNWDGVPTCDTPDINAMLSQIKQDVSDSLCQGMV